MKNNNRLGEDQLLISWLYDEKEELVKSAQIDSKKPRPNIFTKLIVPAAKALLFVIYANPKMFDGQSILSGDSKQHAQLTSGVVSGATLFNAITNWPILFYAFNYAGAASAWTLSTLLNITILWWTNQTGTTAASHKHGNKMWSGTGVLAFLAMSTVQSVVAGVGAELINNQESLSYIKAEELVDEHVVQLETTYESWLARQKEVNVNCRAEESTLVSGSPDYNREFIRIYGGTFDQVNAGVFPNPNSPCAPTQLEQYDANVDAALVAWEETKDERIDTNNDIELLRAIEQAGGAKTYKQHFHIEEKDGREIYALNSGTEAITLASESFWSSFTLKEDGKTGKLGMNISIFFFALSVITSLSATVLIVMHARKLETKMSRSSKVEDAVNYWLESVRRQHAQRPEPTESSSRDKARVDQKLLSLYIDEYRRSGECDYPKVQAIAKMSQEGMDLRLIQDGKSLVGDIETAYNDVDIASSALIEHFVTLKNQNTDNSVSFPKMVNSIKNFFREELPKSRIESDKTATTGEDSVKKHLANLRRGVTRLILLSNRYAAAVSLEGDRESYKAIKSLEKQLKETLNGIKLAPFGALNQHEVKTAIIGRRVSDLPSQLVQLQVDCAELKEITQEEIRNKLIPLFVECQNGSERT